MLFPLIFHTGRMSQGIAFVGRRTLDIYVLHFPLLAGLQLFLREAPNSLTSSKLGDFAVTIGATLLVIALSLGIGAILRRVPGIMTLPAPWHRALAAKMVPRDADRTTTRI